MRSCSWDLPLFRNLSEKRQVERQSIIESKQNVLLTRLEESHCVPERLAQVLQLWFFLCENYKQKRNRNSAVPNLEKSIKQSRQYTTNTVGSEKIVFNKGHNLF